MNISYFLWLSILMIILKGSHEIHSEFQQKNIKLYQHFQAEWNKLKKD